MDDHRDLVALIEAPGGWKATDAMPKAIVATRHGFSGSGWKYGDQRDFEDDAWLIGQPNLLVVDGDVKEVRFDALVHVGGVTLDHPSLNFHRLNKKLACLNLCRLSSSRGTNAANSVVAFGYYFDWLIRFRLDRGLTTNAGLTFQDFEEYCDIISKSPLFRLISFDARLEEIGQGIRSGRDVFPTKDTPDGMRIDLQALGHGLGVPAMVLKGRECRRTLIDFVASLDLERSLPILEPLQKLGKGRSTTDKMASITIKQMLEPWQQLADLTPPATWTTIRYLSIRSWTYRV